jgi:hypothetical protein
LGCSGYIILRKTWVDNRIPEDWCKEIIVSTYKMGDRKQCGNYSEITLLCQTLKIYRRILVNKMTLQYEGKLGELHQFRKGWGTTDLIFWNKTVN